MLVDPYRFGNVPTTVGYVEQQVADGALTFGAHDAGDLILMFLRSTASATPPGTPTDWTSLLSATGDGPWYNGWRIVWRIDSDDSLVSHSLTGMTGWGLLMRNAAVGASAVDAEGLGESANLPSPLSLTDPGHCIVFGGIATNQSFVADTPSGLTLVGDNQSPATGGGFTAVWATPPGAMSFSGYSTAWTDPGPHQAYYRTFAIEITVL